LVVQSCF